MPCVRPLVLLPPSGWLVGCSMDKQKSRSCLTFQEPRAPRMDLSVDLEVVVVLFGIGTNII